MGYSHPTNQLFSLQSTNGVLRTASNFDFENNSTSFQLSVKATDSSGSSTEGNFTITLMNDPSDDPFIPQALSDSNFQTAVNLWFDNQAEANAIYGHISDWNTSAVTDMSFAFHSRSTFNEDIGSWDTSSVKDMNQMFNGASSFNGDINNGMYRLLLTWCTCLMGQLRLIKILILGMYQMWLELETCSEVQVH